MSRQLRPEGYAGRRRTNNNQHPNSDNGSVRQQSNQQQHNRASTGTPGNASIQQQNQLVNGSHTSGSPNTHMSTLQRQLHQNIDIHAVQQQQIFSPLIYTILLLTLLDSNRIITLINKSVIGMSKDINFLRIRGIHHHVYPHRPNRILTGEETNKLYFTQMI